MAKCAYFVSQSAIVPYETGALSCCDEGLYCCMILLASASAHAGFDHEWTLDQNGIWARKYQTGLEYAVIATEVAGSLWLGDNDELGHTLWQTVDSTIVSSVGAEILKLGFSRARPNQGNDPNRWFKGRCCDSFPSGEDTQKEVSSLPFIANYARDDPWFWSLELLPPIRRYCAIEEVKSIGSPMSLPVGIISPQAAYWQSTRTIPLSVQMLPRGFSIGYSKRF